MAKPFSWSFSKLKNFETCPWRHKQVDLEQNFSDEGGEALTWGNAVHKSLAAALTDGTPLPDEMSDLQKWVDKVRDGPGELLVEQKYAITKDFKKTTWFGNNAWYRGIGDVVRIAGPVALIVDWKTGKIKVDSVQLALMSQCIFSHYPDVKKVRSEFIWLAEDCTTPEVWDKESLADAWPGLLDRVAVMETAYVTQNYQPKPGKLCRSWCPVKTCQHNGKAHG